MTSATILTLLSLAAGTASLCLTAMVRRYALNHDIVDQVGARSSHSVPTPRGGGVAIVLVFLASIAASVQLLGMPLPLVAGLIGASFFVAGIGWIDDHGHVSAAIRLAAHFVGAAVLVWALGPIPLPFLPDSVAALAAWPISLIGTVWLINLYNFMDGIDGLAGGEAVAIAGLGAILAAGTGLGPANIALYALLAAASVGFLIWNWPPAKIFMGDAGSGFLGLAISALILRAGQASVELAVSIVILSGLFLCDATLTLLRRLLRGERVYEAHRTHAYQFLSRRAGRHFPVTAGAMAVNLVWLFPLALITAFGWLNPAVGMAIAFAPLIAAAWLVGAGTAEEG